MSFRSGKADAAHSEAEGGLKFVFTWTVNVLVSVGEWTRMENDIRSKRGAQGRGYRAWSPVMERGFRVFERVFGSISGASDGHGGKGRAGFAKFCDIFLAGLVFRIAGGKIFLGYFTIQRGAACSVADLAID